MESVFDTPIKHKKEAYEEIIEIGRNNDYTAGNLLDYEYFSKHCKVIVIDFSKEIELKDPGLRELNLLVDLVRIMLQCFLLLKNQKK